MPHRIGGDTPQIIMLQTLIRSVTSTGPSVTIAGLSEDTDYWIDVRAQNSEGDSSYSSDLATSTLDEMTPPVTPPVTPASHGASGRHRRQPGQQGQLAALLLQRTQGVSGTPTLYRWRIDAEFGR